jgi:hypothetical protein
MVQGIYADAPMGMRVILIFGMDAKVHLLKLNLSVILRGARSRKRLEHTA